MYTGPHLIKDNLVFGYDTGYGVADSNTSTRFYPGRPTTNILSNTVDFNNWTSARNSGSYPTVTANTSANPLGKSYGGMADKVYIPEDGTYPRIQQYFTPSSTNTHTFSVWIRSLSGDCDCFLGAFRNSPWSLPGHSVKNITSEWQRFTFSWTPPDTTTHVIYMGSHDTAAQKGNTLEFWGAQMENNSNSTPYTPGSRSSTQSLIDLKKTTNIDVSNVSFDSTGQPTFDGSNDYINIPSSFRSYFTSAPVAVELVLKKSSADQAAMVVFDVDITRWNLNYNLYTANQWAFDFYDGTEHVISAGNYDNEYVHFVLQQLSNGTMEIYANGILKGTITSSGNLAPNSSGPRIGSRSNGDSRYFKGELPVFKIFSKSLTVDEIKQNFNAYKNRFGI